MLASDEYSAARPRVALKSSGEISQDVVRLPVMHRLFMKTPSSVEGESSLSSEAGGLGEQLFVFW